MSLTVGELNAVLGLDQGPFDRGIASGERKFGKFGSALAGMATKAAIGTAAALGAGAVAGVNQFATLERGMNEVFTLMPGITKDAMGDMTGQVKDFAIEFGTLPNDVVPALYQSLSAGVPPGNVFDFMETAQKAATGGVTDLTTAVDGISSVVNAYGDQIGGATEASDLMFTAVRLGKTNFEELSASLSNVTPIAAANNVAFSDITAALATMTAQGIPTAQATTQMRQAIVELSDAGTGVGETFEELAGKSFREFMAEGGSVSDALGMLEDHAGDTGVSIDQLFGSVEAGGAALALSGKNADKFAANVEEMADSAGATEGAYDQMDQGISRSFDKIKSAGAVALANVGESLAPLVAGMAGFAEDTLPRLAQQIGPMVTNAIATTTAAIGTAIDFWTRFKVPILVVAGVIAASYIPALVRATVATITSHAKQIASWVATQAKALWSIGTQTAAMVKLVAKYAWMGVQSLAHAAKVAASWVIAMGPVGWVIAAVVGLVALIIANWDKVKEWTGKIWSWVSDKIAAVWRWITSFIRQYITMVRSVITGAWNAIKSATGAVWDWITGKIKQAIDFVVGLFLNFTGPGLIIKHWDTIKQATSDLKARVVAIFTGLRDRVVETIGRMIARVRRIKDDVIGFFKNAGTWLIEAGKQIVQGLVDGLKQMAGAPKRVLDGIVGGLGRLLPGSPVKEGPLRALNGGHAGSQMVKMIADGMGSQLSDLERMADQTARAALPRLLGANAPGMTVGGAAAGDGAGPGSRSLRLEHALSKREIMQWIRDGVLDLELETT